MLTRRIGVKTSDGKNLIFLISQPRSGSTMFQLMLARHPEIATTSEPWVALHPLFALRHEIETKYDAKVARLALKEFLKQSGIDEIFYKKQICNFLSTFYKQSSTYQRKKYFLDKTPRYYLIIDDLIELFPNAKFFIILRHPLGVLNSIIKTWVKNDLTRLSLFKDDLLLAPELLIAAREKFPAQVCTIHYENLVERPHDILKQVCAFIGISYSKSMAHYKRHLPDWKVGDPVGIHKHYKPSTDSLISWKSDLSSPQLKLLAHAYMRELGQPLIKEMGYNYEGAILAMSSPANYNTERLTTWSEALKTWSEKTKYEQIKEENSLLIAQQETVRNSLSWKVTIPIRIVSKFWLKIKRLISKQ